MFYDKRYQQVFYQHQATAMHHQQQQQQQPQQEQQQNRYEGQRAWNINEPRAPHHLYNVPWSSPRPQPAPLRSYSGVEQLLMAAMIEGNYPQHQVNHSNPMLQSQQNHAQSDAQLPASIPLSSLPNISLQPPHQHQHQHPQPSFLNHHHQARDYLIPAGRGLANHPEPSYHQLSQDINQVPIPKNSSELALYKLLDKANLLNYFATFLHFGGDDLHQLSEADEEEFMEIMELVGMNKKPLHIRRLQRALANWRREEKEKSVLDSDDFKRPMVGNPVMSLVNRCSSPTDSRRSVYTSATVDTSHPPTPRSNSSHSFLMIPDEQLNESGKKSLDDTDDNPSNKEQQPHILVNAPKRIRLFNPSKNTCSE